MQQKRLNFRKGSSQLHQLRQPDHRIFLDGGSIHAEAAAHDFTDSSCTSRFKAASNPSVDTSKFEDSGLVAGVCRHGIVLTFWNMYRSGEKWSYAFNILKDVMNDPLCPAEIIVLYDIGCMFQSHVRRHLPPFEFIRLKFGIGIFHVYAHEYRCQVLYSPRTIDGVGWVDGENCERTWSSLRHLISTNRTSSSHVRLQVLTEAAIDASDRILFNLSLATGFTRTSTAGLLRLLVNAIVRKDEARKGLDALADKCDLFEDHIAQQCRSMIDFYTSPGGRTSMVDAGRDTNVQIHAALMAHRNTTTLLHQLTLTGVSDQDTVTKSMGYLKHSRIDSGPLPPHTIPAVIQNLLNSAGHEMGHWICDDGSPTELYRTYEVRYLLSEIRTVKEKLWMQLTERAVETESVHTNLHGHMLAKKIIDRIKRRGKKIYPLIEQFNSLAASLNECTGNPVTPITAKNIPNILSDDAFWDLNRMKSTEDWAARPELREGIKLRYQLLWAQEEIIILEEDCRRYLEWQTCQLDGLCAILANCPQQTSPPPASIYATCQHMGHSSIAAVKTFRSRIHSPKDRWVSVIRNFSSDLYGRLRGTSPSFYPYGCVNSLEMSDSAHSAVVRWNALHSSQDWQDAEMFQGLIDGLLDVDLTLEDLVEVEIARVEEDT
jgi:hypothetical protein